MAWTTPRTWVASELVTASLFNTHIRDNLTALRAAAVFTDDSSLASGKKFYVDGGSNTYFSETSADRIGFITGGSLRFSVNTFGAILEATSALFLDGGGNTYLYESSADQIDLVCGGTTALSVAPAGTVLPATNRLYFDGGSDTYIFEQASNVLRCISGGSGGVDLTNGATSWSAVSDERLKVVVAPITAAVDKIAALRPIIGRYTSDDEQRRRSLLIAQDVQRVLPEAVTEAEDGFLRLSYTDLIPLLVAALQELAGRVRALEAPIRVVEGMGR